MATQSPCDTIIEVAAHTHTFIIFKSLGKIVRIYVCNFIHTLALMYVICNISCNLPATGFLAFTATAALLDCVFMDHCCYYILLLLLLSFVVLVIVLTQKFFFFFFHFLIFNLKLNYMNKKQVKKTTKNVYSSLRVDFGYPSSELNRKKLFTFYIDLGLITNHFDLAFMYVLLKKFILKIELSTVLGVVFRPVRDHLQF